MFLLHKGISCSQPTLYHQPCNSVHWAAGQGLSYVVKTTQCCSLLHSLPRTWVWSGTFSLLHSFVPLHTQVCAGFTAPPSAGGWGVCAAGWYPSLLPGMQRECLGWWQEVLGVLHWHVCSEQSFLQHFFPCKALPVSLFAAHLPLIFNTNNLFQKCILFTSFRAVQDMVLKSTISLLSPGHLTETAGSVPSSLRTSNMAIFSFPVQQRLWESIFPM